MGFREASLDTKASPAEVWRVWSDVNTWPQWNPDMKESRLDGPLKLGATGMINTRSGGKHDVVVTHYEDGRSFEEDDIIAFCANNLAKYKCPEKVMFVDELPTNAGGKVIRRALR